MATYYVDPTATGSDDGSSQANAWTSLQRAIDGTGGTQPGAGDTVLCRGSETPGVQIDFDGLSGDLTSGYLKFVGVNSSWVNDGTQYTITGSAHDILKPAGPDYVWLENIRLTTTTGTGNHGIDFGGYTNNYDWVLVNVKIDGCDCGISSSSNGIYRLLLLHSEVSGNRAQGLVVGDVTIVASKISGNAGKGVAVIQNGDGMAIVDSLIIDNGDDGIDLANVFSSLRGIPSISGSVIDGNTAAGVSSGNQYGGGIIYGCRITDNGTGVEVVASARPLILAGCYLPGAGQSKANTTQQSGLVQDANYLGSSSNELAGTDSDGGYTSSAGGDYALAASATLRNQEFALGSTSLFVAAGLPIEDAGGGGGVTYHPRGRLTGGFGS